MSPTEFIAWSEQQESAGVKDAMGESFTDWLLAVMHTDGTPVRNKDSHQVFQTQAEFKRLQSAKVGKTMELFA
jgi:hypothetical protein